MSEARDKEEEEEEERARGRGTKSETHMHCVAEAEDLLDGGHFLAVAVVLGGEELDDAVVEAGVVDGLGALVAQVHDQEAAREGGPQVRAQLLDVVPLHRPLRRLAPREPHRCGHTHTHTRVVQRSRSAESPPSLARPCPRPSTTLRYASSTPLAKQRPDGPRGDAPKMRGAISARSSWSSGGGGGAVALAVRLGGAKKDASQFMVAHEASARHATGGPGRAGSPPGTRGRAAAGKVRLQRRRFAPVLARALRRSLISFSPRSFPSSVSRSFASHERFDTRFSQRVRSPERRRAARVRRGRAGARNGPLQRAPLVCRRRARARPPRAACAECRSGGDARGGIDAEHALEGSSRPRERRVEAHHPRPNSNPAFSPSPRPRPHSRARLPPTGLARRPASAAAADLGAPARARMPRPRSRRPRLRRSRGRSRRPLAEAADLRGPRIAASRRPRARRATLARSAAAREAVRLAAAAETATARAAGTGRRTLAARSADGGATTMTGARPPWRRSARSGASRRPSPP